MLKFRGFPAIFFVLVFLFSSQTVSAHISLLLHEAIGGAGETTSAGHAALYLSNVCGDQFSGLRECKAAEPGVVIASYPEFGFKRNFEWITVPLSYYLYGLPAESEVPLYANGKIRTLLRSEYRERFLRDELAAPKADEQPPKTRWDQTIGVVYNRDVYAFTVATTKEEDRRFIAEFNRRPNVSHFGTMYRNCADFAMTAINSYFPKSVHRDYLNDFTMSTPKAVARALVLGFARKHPERALTVQKFSQVSGPIKRSFDNRNFTEQAFRSKKYSITEAILNQELLGVFVATYYLTARFDVNAQYRRFGTRDLASMQSAETLPLPPSTRRFINGFTDESVAAGLASAQSDRDRTFADKKTWNRYQREFEPLMDQAIANGYFLDKGEVRTFFRDLERQSEPADSPNGLQLEINSHGRESKVGLTAGNILGAGSDRKMSYKLLLCLVRADLISPEKNRRPFDEFAANWQLLLRAARDNGQALPLSERQRLLEKPVILPFKKRLLRDFLAITH